MTCYRLLKKTHITAAEQQMVHFLSAHAFKCDRNSRRMVLFLPQTSENQWFVDQLQIFICAVEGRFLLSIWKTCPTAQDWLMFVASNLTILFRLFSCNKWFFYQIKKTAAGQNNICVRDISIQYLGQVCWRIRVIAVPPFCEVFFYLFTWFEYSSVKLKCREREVERAKYSKLIICSLIRSSYFRSSWAPKAGEWSPTLENLVTHWSRKLRFSRNCPHIRKFKHASRQLSKQDIRWPVSRNYIAGSGWYSGRQGGSTCKCKIWAQINLWRGVDLKN